MKESPPTSLRQGIEEVLSKYAWFCVVIFLIAHVVFNNLAFGSILVAVGIAALFILKDRYLIKSDNIKSDSFYDRLSNIMIMLYIVKTKNNGRKYDDKPEFL